MIKIMDGGLLMIDYDGSGVALLIVEKTIVFISIFILMYVGNKRNWKWYRLSETLDTKTYITRWKWLMLGCFLVFMINKNIENAFLYITLCLATAVPVYSIMLATISRRTLVLKYGELIQAITVLLLLVVPSLYEMVLWIIYVGLYFLPENKENTIPA
ncbi:hypothetical protein SAMN05660648_01910 [Selenomonas ruminantium]|uniref:Uncharacterized protein n=2 Tax=Selenomonas ruminantium TaxID=971 RepID=A0A1H3YF68_SELRU|nr:hypothetical protein SAMN05660648_01910 [Selenomonas ruminantium]